MLFFFFSKSKYSLSLSLSLYICRLPFTEPRNIHWVYLSIEWERETGKGLGKMMKHLGIALFVLILIKNHGNFLHVEADDGFVKTRGVHLILNGSPYYANGFNAYWLMYIATDTSQRDKITSAFEEATKRGLTIGRTWAFSDGGYRPLQSSPGSYNEQTFQVFLFFHGFLLHGQVLFIYLLFW